MRQKFKKHLRGDRGFPSFEAREHLGVIQKKMRERLNMGEDSCSDMETDRKQNTLRHSREVQPV